MKGDRRMPKHQIPLPATATDLDKQGREGLYSCTKPPSRLYIAQQRPCWKMMKTQVTLHGLVHSGQCNLMIDNISKLFTWIQSAADQTLHYTLACTCTYFCTDARPSWKCASCDKHMRAGSHVMLERKLASQLTYLGSQPVTQITHADQIASRSRMLSSTPWRLRRKTPLLELSGTRRRSGGVSCSKAFVARCWLGTSGWAEINCCTFPR